MIIVFIGQPHSGKTTLAGHIQTELFLLHGRSYPIVDGDEIRRIFQNKDFSREGRIKNLNRISDIATFLVDKYNIVLVSAVYPIKEAREYLESISQDVYWVYLTYNEARGREAFHVKDYEMPVDEVKNLITINTSEHGIESCIEKVLSFCRQISKSS
jgi:adenylylsulfate kinase